MNSPIFVDTDLAIRYLRNDNWRLFWRIIFSGQPDIVMECNLWCWAKVDDSVNPIRIAHGIFSLQPKYSATPQSGNNLVIFHPTELSRKVTFLPNSQGAIFENYYLTYRTIDLQRDFLDWVNGEVDLAIQGARRTRRGTINMQLIGNSTGSESLRGENILVQADIQQKEMPVSSTPLINKLPFLRNIVGRNPKLIKELPFLRNIVGRNPIDRTINPVFLFPMDSGFVELGETRQGVIKRSIHWRIGGDEFNDVASWIQSKDRRHSIQVRMDQTVCPPEEPGGRENGGEDFYEFLVDSNILAARNLAGEQLGQRADKREYHFYPGSTEFHIGKGFGLNSQGRQVDIGFNGTIYYLVFDPNDSCSSCPMGAL